MAKGRGSDRAGVSVAAPAAAMAILISIGGCATKARRAGAGEPPRVGATAAARDPGDPLLEPEPSPAELRRLALARRGLPEDHKGEIPPSGRWVGRRHEPPSRPDPSRSTVNIRVNQDTSGQDQNETVLRVNPTDPSNLVGGANDYREGPVRCGFYASLDGGRSWTDGTLVETTYPFQGDPAVAFCGDGTAIYVCLSFTGVFQPHGLFAFRSTDGGRTWSAPSTILNRPTGFPFADKPWAACDATSGPFRNRVYTSWTDFGAFQTPILLRTSTDGGKTWSGNVRVSDGGSTQGSVIAIGPDGTVYVAWHDTSNGSRIGFDRSTNGGQSFGTDRFPAAVSTIPDDPFFRRNSFPVMDVDRSNGPRRGTIYIAWADGRYGDPDILLVRSTDGGETWSAPIRVNDDPLGNGADQWFPWLAVDPTGRVIVTFFDRRRFPGGRPYEIWGAISRDGGASFDTNFLVSEVSSDGSLNDFIGDYSGLAATADLLYPFWTDLRAGTGESDVYTDRFPNRFAYDEVDGLFWAGKEELGFLEQDSRFGQDLSYDIVSGLLGELRADGGFGRAACAAASWPGSPYVDPRIPPEEDAFYFLVRARGPDGVGTYGDGSPARPNVRDPLDEASPCP